MSDKRTLSTLGPRAAILATEIRYVCNEALRATCRVVREERPWDGLLLPKGKATPVGDWAGIPPELTSAEGSEAQRPLFTCAQ
jgi:hypothetical protein